VRLYIAHNFEARDYLRTEVVPLLEATGFELTSCWITDDSHLTSKDKAESSIADYEGVRRAQGLVYFADQFKEKPGKGKFVEFGLAVAWNKLIWIVGEDIGCIFYHLNYPYAKIVRVKDVAALLQELPTSQLPKVPFPQQAP
jgi:hypothetical protein